MKKVLLKLVSVVLFVLLYLSVFSALLFVDSEGNVIGSKSGQVVYDLLVANSTENTDLIQGYVRYASKTRYPEIYAGHYKDENGNYTLMFTVDKALVKKSVFAPILELEAIICTYGMACSYNTILELIDIIGGKMFLMPDIQGVGANVKDNRVTVDVYQLTPEKEVFFKQNIMEHPAVVLENRSSRIEGREVIEETDPLTPHDALIGTVTASVLNVREKGSSKAKVISKLKKGEKVEIIGQQGDWYKIIFKGKEAYVAAKYVKKN